MVNVLFLDEDMVVVDKPAGVAVHAGRKTVGPHSFSGSATMWGEGFGRCIVWTPPPAAGHSP